MFIQILRQGFYQSLHQALFNTLLAAGEYMLYSQIYVIAHIHNLFLRRTHRSNLLKMASDLTSADAGAASTPDDEVVVVENKEEEGVYLISDLLQELADCEYPGMISYLSLSFTALLN